MHKLKIAILSSTNMNEFFTNGLYQNAYTLALMLNNHPNFEVTMVDYKKISPGNLGVIKTENLDFLEKSDILITVAKTPIEEDCVNLQKKGVKIISIKYGNNLNSDLSTFVSYNCGTKPFSMQAEWRKIRHKEYRPDLILYSPHYNFQSEYLAICNNVSSDKVLECPYVWSPVFIKAASVVGLKKGLEEYSFDFKKQDPKNKNIACVEPSINFTKTNLVPIITLQYLYQNNPDAFNAGYIFGSRNLMESQESKDYFDYINELSAFKDGKVTFEGRLRMPNILAEKARVLFSHQKQNALNYTYLEYAYHHLPFVHNSDFLTNYGYYYFEDKLIEASEKLELALNHDNLTSKESTIYNNSCDEMIWNYSPDNPKNISGYIDLIERVL